MRKTINLYLPATLPFIKTFNNSNYFNVNIEINERFFERRMISQTCSIEKDDIRIINIDAELFSSSINYGEMISIIISKILQCPIIYEKIDNLINKIGTQSIINKEVNNKLLLIK